MTWWAAGAAIAGPLISGAMGADSASEGIAAQTEAANKADATQRYMYDTTRADNAPFLNNGTNASNRLAFLMGLGGSSGGGSSAGSGMSADQLRAQLLPQFTGTGSNQDIYEYGGFGNTAPQRGTRQQMAEYMNSMGIDEAAWPGVSGVVQKGGGIDEAGLQAAINARLSQQGAQSAQQGSGDSAAGSLLRKFNANDLAGDVVYQNGLQFGLNEGTKGINNQASATGSMLSGATLKALSRFGNDYGTTKTEGAYNRYTQDNTNTYNKLAGIAGTGQVASSQVGSAGQNYANNVSNNATNLGNARAASGIASTNALSGGLQGAYNNYQGNQMMKLLQGGRYGGGSNAGAYQTGAGTMADLTSYGVF